ncbi:hypothetical protein F8388_001756 [Cannabis sativa]|uniref:Uncharacterized protein n=1 Tax=Cannabis sativa TaxID=3483 RepID=A0A7J6E5M6_CANSA|nr:hypothetical protein G4B88_003027 [Cannabis sativa]KAF4365008.1 hypothetical protein F8388_001756 [Cannabis sativa]
MLSKCLFPVLVVALFLSYNTQTAIADVSSGRSGGRMGGSSFASSSSFKHSSPPPPSSSFKHSSSSSFSSSSRGLDESEDPSISFSFSGYFSNEPRRRSSTFSSPPSHFRNYHYSPDVSTETTRHFDPSSSTVSEEETENEKKGSYSGLLIFLGTVILAIGGFLYLTEPWYEASVLMVQVGLSGKATVLLGDLNRIAETADTSDVKGFHQVLQETVSVLLQHRDYWISGFTYVDKNKSVTESEKSFNEHSLEERKKVGIESLVNFNGEQKRTSTLKGNKLEKNYIVVTVLLSIRGVKNLPSIKTSKNLESSLESLRFVSLADTMAVEVLWTPQDVKDMLSEDDLLENYHHLRPI